MPIDIININILSNVIQVLLVYAISIDESSKNIHKEQKCIEITVNKYLLQTMALGGGHFNFLFYSIYKKTINFSTRIIETVTSREV